MPFTATWMDLEIIIQNEGSHMVLFISKKRNTSGLIYKIEVDPQTQKKTLQLPKEKNRGGRDKLGG